MEKPKHLGQSRIFLFWYPLALTWLMMAAEGPFLVAVVARLAEPEANLAAHGVAFAIAILVEAPIIMIMSASTALAKDRDSFLKLRRFTYVLNAAITLIQALLVFTPAMEFIARNWMELPEDVASLVNTSLIILLPWPGAIGYRRFYQGILIRSGLTRRVAYGTVVRVSLMASTGLFLYFAFDLPGAYVGAASLTAGVTLEALAVRIMAVGVRHRLLLDHGGEEPDQRSLTYREIGRFYYPLALTSTIALAIPPMVTFFVGHSRFALESLAVIPAVNGLVFFFRALGLSYLEAAIALIGDRMEHYRAIRSFAAFLASGACLCLCMIAFTPFLRIWYEGISGLSPRLADFAILPTRILAAIPILSVLLSLQRAILVKSTRTAPVTWSTIMELCGVVALLYLLIHGLDMVGAQAAAIALLAGRFAGNLYLILPCLEILSATKRKSP